MKRTIVASIAIAMAASVAMPAAAAERDRNSLLHFSQAGDKAPEKGKGKKKKKMKEKGPYGMKNQLKKGPGAY